MSQPIQSGAGQTFTAQYFGPVFERKIGRDDQALTFVSGADHVEQQLRSDLAGRPVTQFVEDQQIHFRKLFPESQQVSFFASFHQLRDDLRHAKEANSFSQSTRGRTGNTSK